MVKDGLKITVTAIRLWRGTLCIATTLLALGLTKPTFAASFGWQPAEPLTTAWDATNNELFAFTGSFDFVSNEITSEESLAYLKSSVLLDYVLLFLCNFSFVMAYCTLADKNIPKSRG